MSSVRVFMHPPTLQTQHRLSSDWQLGDCVLDAQAERTNSVFKRTFCMSQLLVDKRVKQILACAPACREPPIKIKNFYLVDRSSCLWTTGGMGMGVCEGSGLVGVCLLSLSLKCIGGYSSDWVLSV